MIAPHEFKPLGNWCLLRRLEEVVSSRVVITGTASSRNFIASLLYAGPAFAGIAGNPPTLSIVMLNWVWGTEEDIFFFPNPFSRYMIVSGERIRALVRGEGPTRRIIPIGNHYLVKQLDEIQPDNIIIPAQFRQSLDFEVVRRGTKCTQDIEPGTRGRITQWQQTHCEIFTDEGHCLIVPESDLLFIYE